MAQEQSHLTYLRIKLDPQRRTTHEVYWNLKFLRYEQDDQIFQGRR